MEKVVNLLSVSDFYKPSNAIIYTTLVDMWNKGIPLDTVTVADRIGEQGMLERIGGPATLVSLIAHAPSTTGAPRYAEIIVKKATYRRALRVAMDLVEAAYDQAGDPNDLIEEAQAALSTIGVRIGDVPPDAFVLDEFLSRPDSERPGWVIPGLIRAGWRVMVVAGEGVGKTVLFRQMSILAAQGIHPLHFQQIAPVRTLIVDLENPEDSVMDVCIPINDKVKDRVTSNYEADRAWLWHRPAGINVRNRIDRIALESVIAHVKPELVCLGPLYKAYEVNAHENDEQAAREVMRVFDDLRTRYSFGLMLEHHAPKETAGSKRKLMPYGSSLWLRWPEIGINLYPGERGVETLNLGRWRGDRLENEWPEAINRTDGFPWTGTWPTGYFGNNPATKRFERAEPVAEPIRKGEPAFPDDEPF
jgi:replicative DNA helicase